MIRKEFGRDGTLELPTLPAKSQPKTEINRRLELVVGELSGFWRGTPRMGDKAIGPVLSQKTRKGWRRLPVVMGSTGELKGQHGLFHGKPEYFPVSYYALRSYEIYASGVQDFG